MKIILSTATEKYEIYAGEADEIPDLPFVIKKLQRDGHCFVSKKKVVFLSAVTSIEVQE